MTAEMLKNVEFRLVGPFRGGRVGAVAGDPVDPRVFYFGSTGGGVWKTTDGGVYWENVSDGFFQRASVGALAIATSDTNVLYAGMGEAASAATCRMATACTARRTPARPGAISDWPIPATSPRSASIQPTRTWYTWPHWATRMARTRNAASSAHAMAARPGTRCCSEVPTPEPVT